ncbi:dolichyl-phosphate mannose synthase related protein [Novosphingobium pentaromativorans US6-1]|uniref:Dolichyl-phosphate mannose synthase related protein n=2 Tax=Novosphingobium pentaromativorans TaxID=205844 RepID=G6E9U4_9SPHN|nr:dolichyl-phosphate mannose synthase related protein [Novosphingobium pentaromativorans US6-1]
MNANTGHVSGVTMSPPLISVIIPVWNGSDVIGRCLTALREQTLPAGQFEVIVVDNGSTDNSVQIAREFPEVVVYTEQRPGSYAARNRGLAHARGRYIAFTDADCRPDPHWLEKALKGAERNPRAGVLAGQICLFEEGEFSNALFSDYERLFSFPQAFARRGNCATANWMSRREIFDKLGGFDENLKSGGDRAMALRIRGAGYPLVYVPEMIVGHPVRATREELIRKRRRLSGGRWDRTQPSGRLARVLGVTLYDTIRRIRRVWMAPGLTIGRKIALVRLTMDLSVVATREYWRLFFGRRSARQ